MIKSLGPEMSSELWQMASRAQKLLGMSGDVATPCLLTAASFAMYFYRHASASKDDQNFPLRGFLAMNLVTMVPLAVLKMKMWKCPDRVGLLPRAAEKVVLLHIAVEEFRILAAVFERANGGLLRFTFDIAAISVALSILIVVFNFQSFRRLYEHTDVINMVMASLGGACCTELEYVTLGPAYFSHARKENLLANILFSAASYLDVLLFVPVLLVVLRGNEEEDFKESQLATADAHRKMMFFFAYLGAFYFYEDVLDPEMHLRKELIALAAHCVHFLMLLDLASFVIFRAWNFKDKEESLQPLLFDNFSAGKDMEMLEAGSYDES